MNFPVNSSIYDLFTATSCNEFKSRLREQVGSFDSCRPRSVACTRLSIGSSDSYLSDVSSKVIVVRKGRAYTLRDGIPVV